MKKIKQTLLKTRLSIRLPFIAYEISLFDLIDSKNMDSRIARLGEIRQELEGAIKAVDSLQHEAQQRKSEVDELKNTVKKLGEERFAAEKLLQIPEGAFARLISRATSKGHIRGRIEGIIIGFIGSMIAGLAIWYITR